MAQKEPVRRVDFPRAGSGQISTLPAPDPGSAPHPYQQMYYSASGMPGPSEPALAEQQGLARKLEEETMRVRLLCEEIERRGYAAGEAAARAQDQAARRTEEQSLRLAVLALEAAARQTLARIETEVVTLSLEIARKILVHEAQLDPLLLAGAVRAALDRLHPAVPALLVVPMAELSPWQDLLSRTPELAGRLGAQGDPSLSAGSCLCRSGLSTLDLSVQAQMDEISRKFKEVLASSLPEKETHA